MIDPWQISVAGIMTGNSLDAVDIATFKAASDGKSVRSFEQVGFYSQQCSQQLRERVLELKERFKGSQGRVTPEVEPCLAETHRLYHDDVNQALRSARAELSCAKSVEVDLIGFHGQTLGHAPPSVAAKDQKPYTLQLVDGGDIADAQNIVTIADFRSDDLLNGGEGAPFAPGFNALLARTLGLETVVFINAGNTSNIAAIRSSSLDVQGWDCGPCNQFPDLLMREELGKAVDTNGEIALRGAVNKDFIEKLWHNAVVRQDGINALDIDGPRSFDPQWYSLPAELRDKSTPFQDRMRTVIAFSAYCVAHSLAKAVTRGFKPESILLFGGGWKNPALREELNDICRGKAGYVLAQHKELFADLAATVPNPDRLLRGSDEVGLPNGGMEAGIFAFAAIQRILQQPFTRPSFTNCKSPTVCGAIFAPRTGEISPVLSDFNLLDQRNLFRDHRLGRAAPGNQ
jgi:anhydro-N-acetylmuramic acid kinase